MNRLMLYGSAVNTENNEGFTVQRGSSSRRRDHRRLFEVAETGGRISSAIEILILLALAFQAGGDTTQAMAALERALTLAEPGGFIRIFVDEGPPMARLLYEALSREIAPDYVRRLLVAFPITEEGQTDPSADLARTITWAGSKQTYYIARLMVDKDLVGDFFRAYAYFRWVDDIVDASAMN